MCILIVALFARAWIEIKTGNVENAKGTTSPSLRGRGLKSKMPEEYKGKVNVALFARAWIEISAVYVGLFSAFVALFARAWIEIYFGSFLDYDPYSSPSLRGRGLKYLLHQ